MDEDTRALLCDPCFVEETWEWQLEVKLSPVLEAVMKEWTLTVIIECPNL